MKFAVVITFVLISTIASSQERKNPVIKNFGGIYDIPEATVKTSNDLEYNIVIDVATGSHEPNSLNFALNNVARLLNLHAISGTDIYNINVVLAVHGPATYAILNNEAYQERYGIDNSHRTLHGALLDAEILADVYLLMTGGQTSMQFTRLDPKQVHRVDRQNSGSQGRKLLKIIEATADEIQAHNEKLDLIEQSGECLWRR